MGMEVHKDNITACIMTPEGKEIQTFSTKTVYLLHLVDWIKQHRCCHGEHECLLETYCELTRAEDIEFLIVNAQHMKAVPGHRCRIDCQASLPWTTKS
jgi:transposase